MRNSRALIAGAAVLAAATAGAGNALADDGREHFRFGLSGANEVPPADPDGEGTAKLRIDTESGEICWKLNFDGIATPFAAHIHGPDAPAGVNAPVFVGLFPPISDPDALALGHAKGCTTATVAMARAIVAEPGEFYVNIHNAEFPGGAIRGQLD
jgi:CHRD domain